MDTMTQTHQTATWRSVARLRSRAHGGTFVLDGRTTGDNGIVPSIAKVNFLAIVPTRRGAPPL